MTDVKPIVFVVDDDPSVRESLGLLVESAGWQPETFGSGQEFLSRPRVVAPSCLVLDMVLPDFNGCDLQALLADRADMPIIFVSGQGDRDDGGARDEGGGTGVLHQALRRRRDPGRDPQRHPPGAASLWPTRRRRMC